MPNKILVATPHPAFGELLRISLEENGPYQVRLVQSGAEAQAAASRASFALAILDADLADPEMPEVARTLQGANPDLCLMVIPLENNEFPYTIEGARVDGKVGRPYYLPELLQTVQALLTPAPVQAPAFSEEHPGIDLDWQPEAIASLPWQLDPVRAAGQLKELLAECTADSLLIVRLRALYASAGRLDESGATQITSELVRYWDGSQKSDLVRFLAHDSPEQDSLLYATALAEEFILALVYDIPIPLTRCRAQSGKLVRLMMTPAPEEEPPIELVIPSEPVNLQPAQAALAESSQAASPLPEPPVEILPEAELEEETPISDEDEEAMAASLAALLEVMPQPDPGLPVPGMVEIAQPAGDHEFRFPWELPESSAPPEPEMAPEPALLADAQLAQEPPPAEQESPGWVTAGGEPVSPFSQPVVEEVWWSAIPQEEDPQPSIPEVPPQVPAPVLPVFNAPPLEPHPQPAAEPLPDWLQLLADTEAPVDPPAKQEQVPAWMEMATQPLTEAELPVEPPARQEQRPAWMDAATQPLSAAELPVEPPAGQKPRPTWEIVDTQPQRVKKPVPQPAPVPPEEPYLGETRRVRAAHPADGPVPASDNFLAETRPRRAIGRSAAQEPSTVKVPAPPEHACTCVLIPHVPEHYLVGGMADLLKQTLVKVAAQNRWKVSQVLVRPQYLQWTTETGEELLPDKVADTMRKRLSALVFKQFPSLKKQNRSGNFWSPEYLALQGTEPIPVQRLRSFTRQARSNVEPAEEN